MKQAIALTLSMILGIVPVTNAKLQSNSYKIAEHRTIEGEAETSTETKDNVEISAPSAILMEASTGSILYEKNAKEQLRPASITKIMTLILIFDALEEGKIHLEDTVTVSEYAASMGGSQVFLEPGETQTVDTMIKCIAVASANDACVAMAEYIAGTEEEFVSRMNERARGLGMETTNFVNCNGLDTDGHMTSAYDVALMSRELINKYPKIHDYSTIWMENITHTTAKGSTEFGLTNTNKLIKQYQYATGLKTGSTGLAKYCVSATAKKDDIELIAVIMAAPDYKVRFQDASTLLNYGFANVTVYRDVPLDTPGTIEVTGSLKREAAYEAAEEFHYMGTKGENTSEIKKEIKVPKTIKAPVVKGEKAGEVIYSLNGNEIGSVPLYFTEDANEAGFKDYFSVLIKNMTL